VCVYANGYEIFYSVGLLIYAFYGIGHSVEGRYNQQAVKCEENGKPEKKITN